MTITGVAQLRHISRRHTQYHTRLYKKMNRKRSFPAVVDPQVHTLILGSLPGVLSLAHSQYYAHPQNRFWKLLAEVIGIDLPALPYAERLPLLLAHGFGLWDVVAEARRDGSLDSNI